MLHNGQELAWSLSLIDLGLCRVPSPDLNMTIGACTPVYAAPELSSPHYDSSVDIFAIGATMLHCLGTAGSQLPVSLVEKRMLVETLSPADPAFSLLQLCLSAEPLRRPTASKLCLAISSVAVMK